MTIKHFKAIAQVIKDEPFEGVYPFDVKKGIAYGLAEYFKSENPLFEVDKFVEACGVCNIQERRLA
jgi:hypothetical protein